MDTPTIPRLWGATGVAIKDPTVSEGIKSYRQDASWQAHGSPWLCTKLQQRTLEGFKLPELVTPRKIAHVDRNAPGCQWSFAYAK